MTPFAPTPALADRVLNACTDPALSLRDIAATFNTTVESLSLWLAHPNQAARFSDIHSVAALRTQCIAVSQLAPALGALAEMIKRDSADAPELPPDADPLRAAVLHLRRLETIRRAATTIVHLSRRPPSLARPPRERAEAAAPEHTRAPSRSPAPAQPTPAPFAPSAPAQRSAPLAHSTPSRPIPPSIPPSIPFGPSAPSDPFPFSPRHRNIKSHPKPVHLLAAAGVGEHWP